ncbi:HINT domain-containing protein [Streptomyces canus]|uniref:polymorphic toxin-type HINT domain-containing protein n=1 Tax=Streptomyces canus TaxID=58343 RepID=UPI0030E379C2
MCAGAEWVGATNLAAGEQLPASTRAVVRNTAVQRWTQPATVHNLTVADIHTHYVLAGETPILVHNCNSGASDAMNSAQLKQVARFSSARLAPMAQSGMLIGRHCREGRPIRWVGR